MLFGGCQPHIESSDTNKFNGNNTNKISNQSNKFTLLWATANRIERKHLLLACDLNLPSLEQNVHQT